MADTVLQTVPLGFQWPTIDPFLFCVHHDDAYPPGNEVAGPAVSLEGRDLGQDFEGLDGWRMYHGRDVPGFPNHPHRGFETVTYVRRGLIDHSDSLGAAARFGRGDVQWLTAGEGIVHSEMFPLLEADQPNPLELFQIWLNLPAEDKLVEPHFSMLWDGDIPRLRADGVEITVIAGELAGLTPPPPPPHSWASRPDADVAIWHLRFEPGSRWTMPKATGPDTVRTLYLFEGGGLVIDGTEVAPSTGAVVRSDVDIELESPDARRRPGPPGPTHRRARGAVRALRHERGARDRAGVRGLPGDAVRWLALALGGAGPHARQGTVRPPPRRHRGGTRARLIADIRWQGWPRTLMRRIVTKGDAWPSSIERCGPPRSATCVWVAARFGHR